MMHKNLKISPLVKVDVHPDLINSSRYIIMVCIYWTTIKLTHISFDIKGSSK